MRTLPCNLAPPTTTMVSITAGSDPVVTMVPEASGKCMYESPVGSGTLQSGSWNRNRQQSDQTAIGSCLRRQLSCTNPRPVAYTIAY